MRGFTKSFQVDYSLLAAVLALVAIGLICLFSTTVRPGASLLKTDFGKQIGWIAIGFIILGIEAWIPLKFFYQGAYVFYGMSMLCLIVVLFLHSGSVQRWIAV
jgi:rod shape determining protein RodA